MANLLVRSESIRLSSATVLCGALIVMASGCSAGRGKTQTQPQVFQPQQLGSYMPQAFPSQPAIQPADNLRALTMQPPMQMRGYTPNEQATAGNAAWFPNQMQSYQPPSLQSGQPTQRQMGLANFDWNSVYRLSPMQGLRGFPFSPKQVSTPLSTQQAETPATSQQGLVQQDPNLESPFSFANC